MNYRKACQFKIMHRLVKINIFLYGSLIQGDISKKNILLVSMAKLQIYGRHVWPSLYVNFVWNSCCCQTEFLDEKHIKKVVDEEERTNWKLRNIQCCWSMLTIIELSYPTVKSYFFHLLMVGDLSCSPTLAWAIFEGYLIFT